MTNKIVAFFASSFLMVALTIPAMAQEVDGTVEAIDRDHAQIRLSDGRVYELPDSFDYEAVLPGMDVVMLVDSDEPLQLGR